MPKLTKKISFPDRHTLIIESFALIFSGKKVDNVSNGRTGILVTFIEWLCFQSYT